LARGYAIVMDDGGRALLDARAVGVGDRLRIRLASGALSAEVRASNDSEEPG
jgi:exonuclease VII large subunit